MIIIILIFIGLLNFKLKIAHKKEMFPDYLSKKYTNVLKGICAVVIVLHHLSQRIDGGLVFSLFARVGCLAVAVFYFLSGYGLMKSMQRNEHYLEHFISRRMSKIVMPYFILLFINILLLSITGMKWNFTKLIDCLLYGEMGIIRVWFILSIVIMYLFFFIAFRVGGKSNKKSVLLLCFFVLCYIGVCYAGGSAGWWYNACLAFVFGVLWCINEEKFVTICERKYWVICGLLFILYGTLRLVNLRLGGIPAFYIISTILPPPIFSLITILVGMKIKINNKLWSFLGKVSFELYLVHSFVIDFLREVVPDISNVAYVVIGLSASIAIAMCLNYANQKILKQFNRSGV